MKPSTNPTRSYGGKTETGRKRFETEKTPTGLAPPCYKSNESLSLLRLVLFLNALNAVQHADFEHHCTCVTKYHFGSIDSERFHLDFQI